MAEKEKEIDPYDVAALEKSLNDSATRVSTIWVSFLIFSLYLLTAATTVTQRQLFLAEPVKLPVLNIDLPIGGFFFLAPILFVILHAYVLLQVILLARTAAAYNEAVSRASERAGLSPEQNASLRQRLANTLFAQIFAGSPREREGAFGCLLTSMAWITLALAPILILLAFQFRFLPYHNHFLTWSHRLLILLEITLAFQLWPLVLNPQRDFRWPNWRRRMRETVLHSLGLFGLRDGRRSAWQGLRRQAVPLSAALAFVVLSLGLASFPGEPHVNLLTGQAFDAIDCKRWIHQKFAFADMRFDRLGLARVDVIDQEKFQKIEQATSKAGERPYEGERTRHLRDRDFNCGDFSDYADLRRVEMNGSRLNGANLENARLDGASLLRTELQGASLEGASLASAHLAQAQLQHAVLVRARLKDAVLTSAQLQGASLRDANLQAAVLDEAQLRGAVLDDAQLQRASLYYTRLQRASLKRAQLQGAALIGAALEFASLTESQLQGASLDGSYLQGASLAEAELQGASLRSADLQGASLPLANLQGAHLDDARLQGADLIRSKLDRATISGAWIWRARASYCANARVIGPKSEAVLHRTRMAQQLPVTADALKKFIDDAVLGIANVETKDKLSERLRERLTVDPSNDDTQALASMWLQCADAASKIMQAEFDASHVALLRAIVCDAADNGAAIGHGVARNWISSALERREFSSALARELLGESSKPCPVALEYDDATRKKLRAAAGSPLTPASTTPAEPQRESAPK